MLEKYYKNDHDKLVAKELSNKIISIILATAVTINSFTIYQLYNEQKTIVVPTNITKEFWVTSSSLSETYLEQIGWYISMALLNVAPNSAPTQFKLVLDLAAPAFYQQLKAELTNQTKYINENGITINFEVKSFKFEKDHISVSGTKKNSIGDKIVEKKDIVLNIYFIVQNGRFYISNFEIK